MDNAQQILKKYKSRVTVCSLAVFFIHMVIAYTLSYVAPTFALLMLVFLYVFAIRVLNNYFWRKYISGILLNDVDAHFYRDIVIAGKFGERNPLFTMESEFFVGNVTAAMQVGNAILKNEKLAKKYAPLTLLLMAEYNFLIGDNEGVDLACKRFRELKLPKFKSKRIKHMEKAIEKYEQYLAGDFEAVLRSSGKKRKDALYHLIYSYFEARVTLCRGEKESARAAFAGLAVSTENTVIGMLSKFAVEAIDSGSEFCNFAVLLPNEPIDTDSLFKSNEENRQKTKKGVVIIWIIAAVSMLSLLSSSIRDWQYYREERITFKLLDEHYDNIEILEWFEFYSDEVMFIASADGGLLLGGRHLDENGEWLANIYGFYPLSDLERDGEFGHAFGNYDNSLQMYFRFYDGFSDIGYDEVYFNVSYMVDDRIVTVIIDDEVIE